MIPWESFIERISTMMDMSQMPMAMMWVVGIYHLLIAVFAALGIAACIKYLRS